MSKKTLAERCTVPRERLNFGHEEWAEIVSTLTSDLAIDRAALATECETLRGHVARLEALVRSREPEAGVVPAGCVTCPRRV